MRVMGSSLSPGAHRHVLGLVPVFHQWNRSLREAKKLERTVKEKLGKGKENVSEVSEMDVQMLFCTKRLGV